VRYAPLWVSLLAVLIISVAATLLFRSIQELVHTRTMVDHTNLVIRTIDEILTNVEEGESRERGYVISGNRRFLAGSSNRDAIEGALKSLDTLVSDNEEQHRDLPLLTDLAHRRLGRIDSVIGIRATGGFSAAASMISTGAGASMSDSIRALTDAMKGREFELLDHRSATERVTLRRTAVVAATGILLAALLFGVAVVLIRRTLLALSASRRSAMQAEALLQSTSDGVYGIDHEGRVTFMNTSMAETLGFTAAEVIGRNAHDLLHHTTIKGSVYQVSDCPIYKALNQGEAVRLENEIIWRKDGTSMPVEYVVSPIRGSRRPGVVVSFRDIADRQRVDAALREGKLAAESANRAKSDFLARMSHELRTPLNSVIGFANVLLRNKGNNLRPQDLTYVERIQKNGVSLLGLINDILDLSKIEAGRVEIDREAVDLAPMIQDLTSQFETHVASKSIQLGATVPEHLAPIETDAGKLRQILSNLIANAIKFTERGEVRVVVTADGQRRPQTIAVSDTGIGIPAGRMEAIFDPFEQAEKSTTRKYGGTGLGLPISRSLCHLLGYDLTVSSRAGEGSTFVIDLRPSAADLAGSQDVQPTSDAAIASGEVILRDRLVLIIDDDADARTLIAHQVAALGGRSAGAATGVDGIRLAREMKPDLITLDLLLPGMDGREILGVLRVDDALSRIPVVVVSIVARDHGRNLAGAVTALSKPLDRNALTSALKHALGLGRVLVVDDDPDTRELLANYVFEAGAAEVRTASGGTAAARQLGEFKPDLVVLDLMMPEGDGEVVLAAVAERAEAGHQTQVIIVTSKELSAGEIRRFELATLGVLRKGAALEAELRESLNRFAAQRRQSPSGTVHRVESDGD
jgi:PAS domain S-box-containing protein